MTNAKLSVDEIEPTDLVGVYLHQVGNHRLLESEEEIELAKTIERGQAARQELVKTSPGPDQRAKLQAKIEKAKRAFDHLVQSNARLVIHQAKKYQNRGLSLSDLIQAGNIGLLRAAKKFDYRRGNRFSTYATWWIVQNITRTIANQGRTIRIPVHTSARLRKIMRAHNKLVQEKDRKPRLEELAQVTGMSSRKIKEILRMSQYPLSLERPLHHEGDTVLGDLLPDGEDPGPEGHSLRTSLKENVRDAMEDALSPREARVIRMRYGLQDEKPYSLQEVGDKEGLSKERVRQIQNKALRRLRYTDRARNLQAYLTTAGR